MTAAEQLNRIVALVAELSARERSNRRPPTLRELAKRFGTSPEQVATDIRTLTLLADDGDAEWLLSLRVWQQRDAVMVASAGPFQRPLRFTPDEVLALRLGLAVLRRVPDDLRAGLMSLNPQGWAAPDAELPVALGSPAAGLAVTEGVLRAIEARRCLEIVYAGEGAKAPATRVIEPHQLVSLGGGSYVVAWCRAVEAWRRFRLDRVIDAASTGTTFDQRSDFAPVQGPDDVFAEPEGGVDSVRVRFSASISRWLRERYPSAEPQPDGSVVVTFHVASVDWFVRRILQYGTEAEVLDPPVYRDALRRALAGDT